MLLLCTDGLNTMISEPDIAAAMASPTGAADIARQLVRAALKAGGEDNVTAVVVRFGEPAADADEEVTSGATVHRVLPQHIDDEPPCGARARPGRDRAAGSGRR